MAPAAALADCERATEALTLIHFETAASNIPRAGLPRLERFARVARHRSAVCIRAQVDAQGGESALNQQLARARAMNIRLFLLSRGVREAVIEIQTQDRGFTLFGLLEPDQAAARVVRLTHN